MKPAKIVEIENVPQEKPLHDLILEMKKLLRPFQNWIDVKILEANGKITEITITARIRP
jgi:hypothetical protein